MTVVRIKNQHLLQHTREALNEIADALNPSPAGRGVGVRVRDQAGDVLFIDARKLGHMIDRTRRDLSPEDIARVADTYHAWRGRSVDSPLPLGEGQGEGYADIPGFCKSATLEEIRKHGHCPHARPLRRRGASGGRRRTLRGEDGSPHGPVAGTAGRGATAGCGD